MMLALAQSPVITTERDEHRGGIAQGIQPHREAGCIAVARGLERLLPQHVGLVTFGCLAGVINSNAFRGSIGTTEKKPRDGGPWACRCFQWFVADSIVAGEVTASALPSQEPALGSALVLSGSWAPRVRERS
jgi:hypothetical protein